IREGYPIGSRVRPPYGFYYIRSLDEKQEYAAQLRSRIHELFGRLYDLDRATAQAELTKQMEMF
ncbi:MAG: hypothetical protein GTO54_02815, partial [Nitrososphaeria archaeon]|nr:hypothetical protein [Nitrososphaeria archaeon]